MNQSFRIVFFGNEHLATGVKNSPLLFEALLKSRHKVVALVIHSSEKTSRGTKKEPIIELAEAHSIPILNPAKTIDSIEDLRALDADCGILAAYGKIIPQEVIDIFPYGIINLHPSLLPKLRGSTPLETTILNGLTETGVSIMQLVRQMDAGPIYTQEVVQIQQNITKQDLADTLHKVGTKNLLEVINTLDTAKQHLIDQNESEASFCGLISKQDGAIDWNEPAETIERKIRAYAGWPKSFFTINGSRYVIHGAETSSDTTSKEIGKFTVNSDTLGVQTGSGTIWITLVQPEGKKEMPIQAFLMGYRNKIS